MAGIENNRFFIVDNSLAQDTLWEMELFNEMIPLKKKWCSHPIEEETGSSRSGGPSRCLVRLSGHL